LINLFEKTLSSKNLKPMITQCCIVGVSSPANPDCMLNNDLCSEHYMQRMSGQTETPPWLLPLIGQRRLRGEGAVISWMKIRLRSENACSRSWIRRGRGRISSDMWSLLRMCGWYVTRCCCPQEVSVTWLRS
jgi:hypothetical protein